VCNDTTRIIPANDPAPFTFDALFTAVSAVERGTPKPAAIDSTGRA